MNIFLLKCYGFIVLQCSNSSHDWLATVLVTETAMALSALLYILLALMFLLFVGFLSFVLYVHYQHMRYAHIPGPARDSFFTGNIPFIRREKKRVPGLGMSEIWYCWFKEYGPVFVQWIYHIPVVILSDPDMAKKALVTLNLPKAHRVYTKLSYVFGERAAGRGILTELDHDLWRRKRAMLNPAFHRKYLMNLMNAFNSVCDDFLANLRRLADGKTPIKMVDEFARVTLDIIGKVCAKIQRGRGRGRGSSLIKVRV